MTTLAANRIGGLPATENGKLHPATEKLESPTNTESETAAIEHDAELHARILIRLNSPGDTVPLDEVLGRLDNQGR